MKHGRLSHDRQTFRTEQDVIRWFGTMAACTSALFDGQGRKDSWECVS